MLVVNTRVLLIKVSVWGVIHAKISQLVNKMCLHCLISVVDKSGTSCYHPEINTHARSCSAPRKLNTCVQDDDKVSAHNSLLRTACISLVGSTYSKSQ